MAIKISSSNRPTLLLDWNQLTEKERSHFDWMGEDERDSSGFVRYLKSIYCPGQFERAEGELKESGWDGFETWTYFSGVVVKLCEDNDYVIMGNYFSE